LGVLVVEVENKEIDEVGGRERINRVGLRYGGGEKEGMIKVRTREFLR
jgi:hypothetical protein